MTVLIVDDSIINLKVAQKILEHENCVVETTTNGRDCIEKVQKKKYDVIFMDIMMPEMDGIETLNKLKELEGFSIPVITLTADATPSAKDKYLKCGFNDYLSKPIQIEELRKVLDSINN